MSVLSGHFLGQKAATLLDANKYKMSASFEAGSDGHLINLPCMFGVQFPDWVGKENVSTSTKRY